jgi:O-6-methylguanine DNA methyltransferase
LAQLADKPSVSLVARIYTSVVRIESAPPVGAMFVAYSDQGISYVRPAGDENRFVAEYQDRFERPVHVASAVPGPLAKAIRTGQTRQLTYDLRASSAFEQAVLRKALEIPRGETRPYGWVAAEIGRDRAVRAVGTALGRNPVPFLIPCHRVVRSDGSEGEYGFGPEMKRQLLTAEDVNLDEIHDLARSGTLYLASDSTGVVCYPSCRQARRISPADRVGFRSVAQARAAGFRPCLHCRPTAAAPP